MDMSKVYTIENGIIKSNAAAKKKMLEMETTTAIKDLYHGLNFT